MTAHKPTYELIELQAGITSICWEGTEEELIKKWPEIAQDTFDWLRHHEGEDRQNYETIMKLSKVAVDVDDIRCILDDYLDYSWLSYHLEVIPTVESIAQQLIEDESLRYHEIDDTVDYVYHHGGDTYYGKPSPWWQEEFKLSQEACLDKHGDDDIRNVYERLDNPDFVVLCLDILEQVQESYDYFYGDED